MLFDGFSLEYTGDTDSSSNETMQKVNFEKIGYILGFFAWLSTLFLFNYIVYLS